MMVYKSHALMGRAESAVKGRKNSLPMTGPLQKLGLSAGDLDAIGHENAPRLLPRLRAELRIQGWRPLSENPVI
jgi:hypothetical protein